jgi:DNA-binding transcriptional ArsR family regulator
MLTKLPSDLDALMRTARFTTSFKHPLDYRSHVAIVKNMLEHSLDRVFHALSDPTRRHMLERLARAPAAVSELAAPFGMSLAAVLQHVQVLEECGVVRTEKVGRTRMCKLEPKSLSAAERWCRDRRVFAGRVS